MITSKQIEELSSFRSGKHYISSLYLQLWPDSRAHQAKMKDLIGRKREELREGNFSSEEKQEMESDLEKLSHFVETFKAAPYQGLVAFSSTIQDLWLYSPLPQPVKDLLVFNHSPYIRPLTTVLGRYRRIFTLLVDQTKARFFEIFMGEIEEQSDIYAEVPSRVREAGWYGLNEKRIERHIGDHLHNHLKKVSEKTFNFFREKEIHWLLLGGQPETVSEIEKILHPSLKARLKRTFRIDLNSPPKDVLEKSIALEEEIKKEEDRKMVARLSDTFKPEGLGVAGIQETLSSLFEGEVQTLLIEEGFLQKGAYCPKCGFMGLRQGLCPVCRETMIAAPDIVADAASRAMEQNCEVFYLTPGSGLKDLGSIGAILRYKAGLKKETIHPSGL